MAALLPTLRPRGYPAVSHGLNVRFVAENSETPPPGESPIEQRNGVHGQRRDVAWCVTDCHRSVPRADASREIRYACSPREDDVCPDPRTALANLREYYRHRNAASRSADRLRLLLPASRRGTDGDARQRSSAPPTGSDTDRRRYIGDALANGQSAESCPGEFLGQLAAVSSRHMGNCGSASNSAR